MRLERWRAPYPFSSFSRRWSSFSCSRRDNGVTGRTPAREWC